MMTVSDTYGWPRIRSSTCATSSGVPHGRDNAALSSTSRATMTSSPANGSRTKTSECSHAKHRTRSTAAGGRAAPLAALGDTRVPGQQRGDAGPGNEELGTQSIAHRQPLQAVGTQIGRGHGTAILSATGTRRNAASCGARRPRLPIPDRVADTACTTATITGFTARLGSGNVPLRAGGRVAAWSRVPCGQRRGEDVRWPQVS